jgi:hypothetical protein
MAFLIAPYPGQTYAGRYAQHADIRAYLGWAKLVERQHWSDGSTITTLKVGKLPMGYQGWTMVPLTDGRETKLICLPGHSAPDWRGKSSKHRTFAVCPDCGAHVPAGRTHQHKCK